jgi:hypothetical protein
VEYRFAEQGREELIHSDCFTLGFSHEVPITWDLITANDGVNVIDRMKLRMHARFFHMFDVDRNEIDFRSRLWQYKDGPVRVVRRVRSSIKLVANLQSPSVSSETLYYRNAVLLPFRVKIPFMPKTVASDLYFEGGVDYRDLYGWKVRLNTDERWLTVDGRMDADENSIKTDGARWFIMKGPQKAMIYYLTMCNEKELNLRRRFHYLDDDKQINPPEFHPAQVPYIGYLVDHLEDLRGGEFRFFVIAFFLDQDYSEEELMRAMNVFDNPVRVEVQSVSAPNPEPPSG